MVTNKRTRLCPKGALYKLQLPRKIVEHRTHKRQTRATLSDDFHPLGGCVTGNSATWSGIVTACPHWSTHTPVDTTATVHPGLRTHQWASPQLSTLVYIHTSGHQRNSFTTDSIDAKTTQLHIVIPSPLRTRHQTTP